MYAYEQGIKFKGVSYAEKYFFPMALSHPMLCPGFLNR